MSDPIKHECGIAFVRLLKPLAYYLDRYGTALWGFNRLFLLMEKQHNRGHDGVGIGCCKLDMPLGQPYLFRDRSARKDSLSEVFEKQIGVYDRLVETEVIYPRDPENVKRHFDYAGENLLGHLRYGTSGRFGEGSCHPYLRRTNWPTKSLMVLGNFNMTNALELNRLLIGRGQHPVFGTDTQTVLEELGFHLDEAHQDMYHEMRDAGVEGEKIPGMISDRLDMVDIIRKSAANWDGGYTIAGVVGNGDGFVFRDPQGIRPCFYYRDEEVIAFASERVPLMTVFGAEMEQIAEVDPGHVIAVKKSGEIRSEQFAEVGEVTPCSFERIYFSRGNDPDIYKERKALGAALVPKILESIDNDLENTVLSFVPNTAEIAYHGMMEGLRLHRGSEVRAALEAAVKNGGLSSLDIDDLVMHNWPRGEKIAHKDIKMRTFISQEAGRDQMVSHVYDITYGVVESKDNLVVIDDSIVRGTTLRKSILKILARTNPRKIVIASTAPQIRYPDCYGIDMSELGKFIAFQAAVRLLKRTGLEKIIEEVYEECQQELTKPVAEMANMVRKIYEPFSADEISEEIGQMVRPMDIPWKGEVEVIYQSIGSLRASIPVHR
ncbi:MAG: amidophosphoribosyltransferase, partial [Verrucomicrobiales bacterium]